MVRFLPLLLTLPLAARPGSQSPRSRPRRRAHGRRGHGWHYQWVPMQFIGAAEAMPGDKYDFAPTQGEFKEGEDFRPAGEARVIF